MRSALMLAYGGACYLLFLATFLYLVGFIVDAPLPTTIDRPLPSPAGAPQGWIIDLALLALFWVQHSTMARRGFKAWIGRWIHPGLERSTYVLATTIVLIAWFRWWRPLPSPVWDVGTGRARWLVYAIAACGWLTVLAGTWMIDHFDLVGLRQAWLAARGRPCSAPGFVERWLYRLVRHPLMLGFIVAFWAAPRMTAGHLLFAVANTGYILIAVRMLEERDLIAIHGDAYRAYRQRVPMLCPWPRPRSRDALFAAKRRDQVQPFSGPQPRGRSSSPP